MKINKLKLITFSLIFSSVGALGSGCYYNAKRFSSTVPTPPNFAQEPVKSLEQNSIKKENTSQVSSSKEESSSLDNKTVIDNQPSRESFFPNNSYSDSSKVKGENIISSAKNYATSAEEVVKMLENPSLAKNKTVFLTFDDGPDINKTPRVLNILQENNVHATFFVLGSRLQSQTTKNILVQTYKNGNAIANHSYSHNMKAIYPHNTLCISTFMNEVNQTNTLLKDILGSNFDCAVLRMPGGYTSRAYYNDPNLEKLNNVLKENQVVSIDWNAENGDAVNGSKDVAKLLNNVKKYSYNKKVVVLLMHDIHNVTVQALPSIIEYYKTNGYEFRVISN